MGEAAPCACVWERKKNKQKSELLLGSVVCEDRHGLASQHGDEFKDKHGHKRVPLLEEQIYEKEAEMKATILRMQFKTHSQAINKHTL